VQLDREHLTMRDPQPEDEGLALYALLCVAATRTGGLDRTDLLASDAAVDGLQVLAEREDLDDLLAGSLVPRMEALWEQYGPQGIAFDPEWARFLQMEHRSLLDALSLATATVNYWQLKRSG
jgi:hypothetical protein